MQELLSISPGCSSPIEYKVTSDDRVFTPLLEVEAIAPASRLPSMYLASKTDRHMVTL